MKLSAVVFLGISFFCARTYAQSEADVDSIFLDLMDMGRTSPVAIHCDRVSALSEVHHLDLILYKKGIIKAIGEIDKAPENYYIDARAQISVYLKSKRCLHVCLGYFPEYLVSIDGRLFMFKSGYVPRLVDSLYNVYYR